MDGTGRDSTTDRQPREPDLADLKATIGNIMAGILLLRAMADAGYSDGDWRAEPSALEWLADKLNDDASHAMDLADQHDRAARRA